MTDKVIIAFPPSAGGNHLKNLLQVNANNIEHYRSIYNAKAVHNQPGHNLKEEDLAGNLMHGHFGEIMSFQNQFREMPNKRFIMISPDTYEDRKILAERFNNVNSLELDCYYDHEQVFLYEPFMFHYYFGTSFDDIMNISVHELFNDDINDVIDRLNFFLRRDLSKDCVIELHERWRAKNNNCGHDEI